MDNYIDPSEILAEIQVNWRDYWQGDSPYERTKNLLSYLVAFPHPEIQIPLVASYLWTNPKFSSVLPVLFCYGQPGSAKSNLAIIASKLRLSDPLNADNCTPVSLRNTCNAQKFLDEEKQYEADGALLILDNVGGDTFQQKKDLLALFLGGYKRGQDKVQIGGKDGTNIDFYTFSSRIISSVEPIHLQWALRELASRCWVMLHKPLELIPESVLKGQIFDIEQAIKPEDVNWKDFCQEYLNLWGNRVNCKMFATHKSSLRNTEKFSSRRWEMARDVLVTGLLIEAWETPKEAKRCLLDYYDLMDSYEYSSSPLEEVLGEDFIPKIAGDEVDNSLLVSFIDLKTSQKVFLEKPRGKAIEDAMKRLGWKQRKDKWERME